MVAAATLPVPSSVARVGWGACTRGEGACQGEGLVKEGATRGTVLYGDEGAGHGLRFVREGAGQGDGAGCERL